MQTLSFICTIGVHGSASHHAAWRNANIILYIYIYILNDIYHTSSYFRDHHKRVPVALQSTQSGASGFDLGRKKKDHNIFHL